ncbi:hypothetical protein [Litorimonas sp. WD9-15]|uniref:hypothetical protein n=1 Tax=Litorimonas sp. WD9-15 TaxID=3418716 RepID=UPI003D018287
MPLKNTLPPEYERSLSLVANGKAGYQDTFEVLLKELNPARVTSISNDMRKALWSVESQGSDGWWMKSKNGLKSILKTLDTYPEISALFSVSWNGYVREKAVRTWPRINNSFELSLLLIRLNDWVEQVRYAAISKLENLIASPVNESGLTHETVLGCMDLILNKKRFGRSREVEFRVLNQLLNMNNMPFVLAEYVTNNSIDSAPRYLKHGLKRGILVDALPSISKEGKHPEVRRIATNTLLNGIYSWKESGSISHKTVDIDIDKNEIAATALTDKSPPVRSVALSYISDSKPYGLYCEKTFRDHLTDKRFSIVERAIYGLKSLEIDYVNEVRQQITNGQVSVRSLEILSRYGSNEDGNLIYSSAQKVARNDRVPALGAAAKLGNRSAMDALEAIAFGKHDNEARHASNRLAKTDYSPNVELILSSIRSGQDIRSRGYLRLIRRLPTMKLALAIAELHILKVKTEDSNLWQLLTKKRNTGAFLPSEREMVFLKETVGNSTALKERFHKTLGLKL